MQVIQTPETQQVISPHSAQAFTVATTPLIFQTLSKNLYSKPHEAVLRETFCNAWDAHKAVGKEDVPIEVTFENSQTIIEDFGPGIPDHLMQDIYCTYSKTTKEAQDNQTGGFGLGCKSPFAITDTFTVISTVNHVSTMYSMTLNSAELDGLPALIKIHSFDEPNKESGLKVILPINMALFSNFACQLAKVASVPTLINGELQTKFEMLEGCPVSFGFSGIRYGDVLYPIPKKFYCFSNEKVTFHAPPNTLTLHPSRECLVMDEKTLKQLRKLFKQYDHWKRQEIHKFLEKEIEGFDINEKKIGNPSYSFWNKKQIFSYLLKYLHTNEYPSFSRKMRKRLQIYDIWHKNFYRKNPILANRKKVFSFKGAKYYRVIASNSPKKPEDIDYYFPTVVFVVPLSEINTYTGKKRIIKTKSSPKREWWEYSRIKYKRVTSKDQLEAVDVFIFKDDYFSSIYNNVEYTKAIFETRAALKKALIEYPEKAKENIIEREYTEIDKLGITEFSYLFLGYYAWILPFLGYKISRENLLLLKQINNNLFSHNNSCKELLYILKEVNSLIFIPKKKKFELIQWILEHSEEKEKLCELLDSPLLKNK